MKNLNGKAWVGLAFLIIVLGLLIFIPAGTAQYWEAWVYLFLFASSTLAITLYLMKRDPKLLEKRVKAGPTAESDYKQKIISAFASLAFIALFVVSSLDHIQAWSYVPFITVMMGEALVVIGFYVVFLVFKENTFTSATIEVDADQKVISSGPYGVVRHPMYSGAFIMLLGTPLALGSLWGLAPVFLMFLVVSLRMFEEEKFLRSNLTGYDDYCRKVRWRLIPGIF
jgi:protein-S-isoprenylcysteine O-methyltransferase Ste14